VVCKATDKEAQSAPEKRKQQQKGGDEMKLLTKTLEKRFAKIGSQENVKDPLVIAKFFNPTGVGTWYATEYDPKHRLFFGYASIFGDWNDEWGYFSLDELAAYKGRFGLGIERDLYFGEKRISEVVPEAIKLR
jgi:hypothetical protein